MSATELRIHGIYTRELFDFPKLTRPNPRTQISDLLPLWRIRRGARHVGQAQIRGIAAQLVRFSSAVQALRFV
jgi:hypothetical protein